MSERSVLAVVPMRRRGFNCSSTVSCLPGWTKRSLQCRLTEVENARESVDSHGRIQGWHTRSTSATLSNRASGVLGSLAFGDPTAAGFTVPPPLHRFSPDFSEPEISPAGRHGALITEPTALIVLPGRREATHTFPPIATTPAEKEKLSQLAEQLPFRTVTDKSHVPSDITNLIFIGSAGAVERAFAASDWVQVDTLTAESTYSTIRSVAENQGYKTAPMSTLLLGGQAPRLRLRLKKPSTHLFQTSPFASVGRVRLPGTGKPYGPSSSTHDTGIGFFEKEQNIYPPHRYSYRQRARQGGERLHLHRMCLQRAACCASLDSKGREKRNRRRPYYRWQG